MPKVRKIHVRPQDSSVFQQGVDGECGGLRVAAYARVSTEQESQSNSFQAQKDYYEKLIKTTPGWSYAGIYADRGISGTSTDHREGFQQLMEDCRAGNVDRIITKSVSRFARNTVDSLNAIRELKALGIGIEFQKEGIFTLDSKGEFLITVMSSLSQEESRSRGIRRRELEQFIQSVEKLPEMVTEFDEALWGSLVDHLTVNAKDDIVFTLTSGMEMKVIRLGTDDGRDRRAFLCEAFLT